MEIHLLWGTGLINLWKPSKHSVICYSRKKYSHNSTASHHPLPPDSTVNFDVPFKVPLQAWKTMTTDHRRELFALKLSDKSEDHLPAGIIWWSSPSASTRSIWRLRQQNVNNKLSLALHLWTFKQHQIFSMGNQIRSDWSWRFLNKLTIKRTYGLNKKAIICWFEYQRDTLQTPSLGKKKKLPKLHQTGV